MAQAQVKQLPTTRRFMDRLSNLVSGLGTTKDKAAGFTWVFTELTAAQLEAAYRSDWMARKIIDIPADDATREWRSWYADDKVTAELEAAEKKHRLQRKVCEALQRARLYGGAVLLMGVGDQDPSTELDPETVAQDDLKFIHVMSRWDITSGEIDRDPMSEFFGEPTYYEINSMARGLTRVHPSRVVRFMGNQRPSTIMSADGWGDSVLQTVQDAIHDAGGVQGSIASLVSEAKVDIIQIPEFAANLSNDEYSSGLVDRFTYANTLKSTVNMLLLDKEEVWTRQNVQFGGLPDIARLMLLALSGAADIPATRMLGQSPAGMSATGESDTRNYYDRISSEQETDLTPALERLDEVLQRSATGTFDEDVYYEWDSLWQQTADEAATTNLKLAQAYQVDVNAGLINDEILAEARSNQIMESDAYPGWKQIVDDHGGEIMAPEPDPNDPAVQAGFEAMRQKALASQGLPPDGGVPPQGGGKPPANLPKPGTKPGKATDANPYHVKSGEHGGEFTSGPHAGSGEEDWRAKNLAELQAHIGTLEPNSEEWLRAKLDEIELENEISGYSSRRNDNRVEYQRRLDKVLASGPAPTNESHPLPPHGDTVSEYTDPSGREEWVSVVKKAGADHYIVEADNYSYEGTAEQVREHLRKNGYVFSGFDKSQDGPGYKYQPSSNMPSVTRPRPNKGK